MGSKGPYAEVEVDFRLAGKQADRRRIARWTADELECQEQRSARDRSPHRSVRDRSGSAGT